ncbi:TonB-dependent receptor domain-containing protein [Undibacterium macrobrachii]|uniref:Outer membrane protein n=1 Tax=Undibacterium macrobrachii TaxID=1119058 RepID=A0ABQ2X752_9BURK|nr:TonB-dependent receptor [Undibacterium macrobrachii]GGX02534.1 outer membrane protein [Undibacterium macrobrachii]
MKNFALLLTSRAGICVACAASTVGFVINSANAQTATTPALQDVVITANRIPTKLTDVIADVTVLDRSELDLAGQSSLLDVLANLPGIQISRNGSYRSSSGVFLRGATSSQTVILLDGVRIGSATSGTPALENIPLDRIERIEVLRGAASALYGADAVGGVIQIITREPERKPVYTANVGIGGDGQRQASVALRGSASDLGYSLGWSRERADGISVLVNPLSSAFNPDRDGFQASSVDAKLRYQLSPQHQVSVGILHSDTDYQFDGAASPNPLKLTKANTDARAYSTLNNLSAQWQAQWLPNWKSTLLLGTAEDQSVTKYFRSTDGAFGGSGKFNTDRRHASWQNDFSLGQDVLSFALEERREEVDSSMNYAVKARDLRGVMLSYALRAEDWSALAVLRSDHNSQFGSFTNWSLSGGYQLNPAWRAVLSAGTSFQAPSFNQLYYPGFGNPTLTPQQNRSNELGLKYREGHLNFEATVYQNDIRGFITPSTNLQSALAELRGVSLHGGWQFGASQISASYDYADPRTQPNNLRLLRIARHVANFRLQHQLSELSLFTELKFSSDREDNNLSFTGRDKLAAYSLLNVGLNWQINSQWALLLRINNLNNSRYVLANNYSTLGRNAFASLSWKY